LLYTADTSFAFNPKGGQIVGEYLADIAEAAGRRKAFQIYDKGKAGEISIAEAMEALGGIEKAGYGFKPLSLRSPLEILKMEFDPADLLLANGYLVKGSALTILGQGGLGKSRFALQLAVCSILGRDFLGWKTSGAEVKWLFLQTENGCRRLKADLGKMMASLSKTDFAKLDGIKAKGAERIHVGLRAAEKSWTTLTFLVASSTMPRGVGHTKLTPLLALNPNPATWSAAELKAAKPAGLSPATIDAVVAAVPAFQAWIAETGLAVAGGGGAAAAVAAAVPVPDHQMTVVFTGVRDKALEATLQSMGHIVADAVTKKTTHVIYADDAAGETTKVAKAKSLGIPTQTLSEFKANLGL
jgi:hypothetical protein